jgi:ATP-binding cassette subfamily F protein 3
MLAQAMAEFNGTIIFVSHDEFFISKVANRIIEVRPGAVRDFPGTLADYRFYVETLFSNESEKTDEKATSPSSKENISDKEQRIKDREQRKKLMRAVEKIEREIASHEEKIAQLKTTLNDPVNALNHELLHKASQELELEEAQLETLMFEWEEKQTELSTIE